MQTPEEVLTLVLAGLHDGENQCSDTDGSELVAMTSVGRVFLAPRSLRPYTAGIWGCFIHPVQLQPENKLENQKITDRSENG